MKYFGKEFQGDIIFLCNFFRIDDPTRCHVAKLDRRNVLKGHERIGELVMRELKKLDKVAYVRFASVYRSFEDIDEFKTLVDEVRR